MSAVSGLRWFGVFLSVITASLHLDLGSKVAAGLIKPVSGDPLVQLLYDQFFFYTGILAAMGAVGLAFEKKQYYPLITALYVILFILLIYSHLTPPILFGRIFGWVPQAVVAVIVEPLAIIVSLALYKLSK